MHLLKLVKTLLLFDKPTMKKLGNYLHSPYFKVSAPVIDLFDYVQPLHPVFPEKDMLPEAIKALAGTSLSTAKTQSNVAAMLLKEVDRFMAFENLQKNTSALHFHALHEYKQRQLTNLYSELWQQATEKVAALPDLVHNIYWYEHKFTELQYSGLDARLKREEDNDLSPLAHSLDVFYALKKLFYLTEMQLRHFQFGTPLPAPAAKELIETLQPYTSKKQLQVFATVQAYRMVSADSFDTGLQHFEALKHIAGSAAKAQLHVTLARAIRVAHRWCVHWFNRGIQPAAEQYLWCIEFKMKHRLLLQDEAIDPTEFCNTLIVAMQEQKPAVWLRQFMEQHSPYLPLTHRETSLAFGNGLYCYMQKNYTQAIRYYRQAQAKDDAIFNALMRRWEFTALYEDPKSTLEEQLNHLEAFKKYLQRNAERLPHVKPGFERFITYCLELLQGHSGARYNALYTKLQGIPHFPGKTWLGEQMAKKQKPVRAGTG